MNEKQPKRYYCDGASLIPQTPDTMIVMFSSLFQSHFNVHKNADLGLMLRLIPNPTLLLGGCGQGVLLVEAKHFVGS